MKTEQDAAAALLDKGLKVRVTAPLFLRLFGKKTISLMITQPSLGSLYRISYLFLKMGIDEEQLELISNDNAHKLFAYGKQMAKIAALASLNSYWGGKLLAGIVGRWMYWHITPMQLLTLVNVLVIMTSTESFTNTIRLAATMRMTKPNLSQESQGS